MGKKVPGMKDNGRLEAGGILAELGNAFGIGVYMDKAYWAVNTVLIYP
jgi:hypothetical protein